MKKLAKIGIIVILVATAGSIAAYFIAKKYEPEVRTIVLYELNRHLNVEVKVDDINFSLLQRFPYASLRFSEVVIPEVKNGSEGDTLIYIKDLYLQIGLMDFFSKNYRVSEAEVNTGFFRMENYPDGSNNYTFWKTAADTAGSSALSLTNIELSAFSFRLRNGSALELQTFIKETNADGSFGLELYDIQLRTDMELNYLIASGDTLYRNKSIAGPVLVNIDQGKGEYGFSAENLALGKEAFKLDGTYTSERSAWKVDLATSDAKIEHLADLVPMWLLKSTKSYKARGKTDLQLLLSSSKTNSFSLDMLFKDTRGSFQHQAAMGTAKISDAAGSIQVRGSVTSLFLDKVRMGIGPGEIKGFGKVINFNAPAFDLTLEGNMDLEEFKNFVQIPLAERLEGKLSLNGRLHGKLSLQNGDQTLQLLKGIDFDGDISLKSGAFKFYNKDQVFERVKGNIEIRDNALIVKEGSGEVNGSPFAINGKIQNALPYISTTGQKLHIAADFSSPSLDFNAIWSSGSSKKDTLYAFALPEDVSFDLAVEVGKVNFRRFEATHVKGKAYYKKGLLTLNPFSFSTASGQVRASATITQLSDTDFTVSTRSRLDGIAIDELFYAFEDFGQSTVRSTHLEGTAIADITFSARFGSDLQINAASINSDIDLVIIDGKLKKLESLQAIADYLRSNTLWRTLVKVDAFEKKIQVVAFDTLQNSIKIADKKVVIPAMSIGSSAMTIGLSGTHYFTNQIDYAINFKLSELLQTGQKQDEEFGYVVEDQDGLKLFMRMTGTTDDPEFSMDREGARSKRKRELEQEKNVLKSILREEFGLFKSDSTLQGVPKKQGDPKTKFELEWDGFDKPDSAAAADPKKKKAPGKPSKKDKGIYDDLDDDDDL